MIWLAAHMWLLLILAFFIGLSTGWWVWGGGKTPEQAIPPTQGGDSPMGTLESDGSIPSPPEQGE